MWKKIAVGVLVQNSISDFSYLTGMLNIKWRHPVNIDAGSWLWSYKNKQLGTVYGMRPGTQYLVGFIMGSLIGDVWALLLGDCRLRSVKMVLKIAYWY